MHTAQISVISHFHMRTGENKLGEGGGGGQNLLDIDGIFPTFIMALLIDE